MGNCLPVAPAAVGQGMTLGDLLWRSAHKFPERIALRYGESGVTFRRLWERAAAVAAGLSRLGVHAGDRVAVAAESRPETVELYFANAILGAITVPINPRLTSGEVATLLRDCEPAVAVTTGHAGAAFREAVRELPFALAVVILDPEPSADGWHAYADLDAGVPMAPDWGHITPESPAIIIYTSGTSGRPKGAVLTHANLILSTLNVMVARRLTSSNEVWLVSVPLFHISGVLGFLPYLMLGGRVVLAGAGGFDSNVTLDLMAREGVTSCFFVPTQWQRICASFRSRHRSIPLQRAIWGGAPATAELLAEIRRLFPQTDLYCSYGQTEVTGVSCSLAPWDTPTEPNSIGRPVLGVATRIVDDAGLDVPPGEVGELVYRGTTLFAGYWRDSAATEAAFLEGWFRSGDLARQDSAGYLYLAGRRTEMIISGGENIYPVEVEEVISAMPGVDMVAVFGVPHSTWGETPVAAIVRDAAATQVTEEDVRRWCTDRLAGYKRPSSFYFVPSFPLTPNGKVHKAALRDQFLLSARPTRGR